MRILITGANGLLGQKLVYLFSERSVPILATSKGDSRIDLTDVFYKSLDVTDLDQTLQVVKHYQPTTIIHTAALTQVDVCETEKTACWDLNVNAVANLIQACEGTTIQLIHLSTDFIFDGKQGPYKEDDQPNPINYYGTSKLAAENLLLNSSISYSIIRTVLVYGSVPKMSRSNIMLWVKDSLESGKEIKVVDDQFRTPTLAEDLALGCLLAAQKKARGIYHISGKNLLTPYDIAQITAEYFGLDKKLIKRANHKSFTQTALRPLKTGFDIEKARKDLGYEPRSFEEGLAITADQWG